MIPFLRLTKAVLVVVALLGIKVRSVKVMTPRL